MTQDVKEKQAAIHILLLLYHAKRLNWSGINKSYVNWSMYQINILVHFYQDDIEDKNLSSFTDIYEFVMEPTGPLCDLVNQALEWLVVMKYVKSLIEPIISETGINKVRDLLLHDNETKPIERWIDIMITLQSVYGYEQLFRFIYRDPEFKNKLMANNPTLETGNPQNDTVEFLKSFKCMYDEVLRDSGSTKELSKKEYLIGYFRYVFELIKRGEE